MNKLLVKLAGLYAASLVFAVASPSMAEYTFGRLRSVAGGVLQKDESNAPSSCSQLVQDNLHVKISTSTKVGQHWTDWSVTSDAWGPSAKDALVQVGLPVTISDSGVNTCSYYNNNPVVATSFIKLWFNNGSKPEFRPNQSYGVSYVATVGTRGYTLVKTSICAGHSAWRLNWGTGGPSWRVKYEVDYYKSWLPQ